MSVKILKWGNSADDKKAKLQAEAKRIKVHSTSEYEELEATLNDGLKNIELGMKALLGV